MCYVAGAFLRQSWRLCSNNAVDVEQDSDTEFANDPVDMEEWLERDERHWEHFTCGKAAKRADVDVNPRNIKKEYYVIVRADLPEQGDDTSIYYVDGIDVPLWLGKVKEIVVDENMDPKQWKMSWYSAYTLNGVADNIEFKATGQTEWLDVDMSTVVAYTTKLPKGKRNPKLWRLGADILKRLKKVLSLAQVAEDNGDLVCHECGTEKDEEMLECGGCSKRWHTGCAAGWDEESGVAWWCPDCMVVEDADDDDVLNSLTPA